ncbi:MAG: glycosyltransferase [Mariprofundaceae bacterium]|nr:glycosyltransferase [Mariprofundaceae bacterium]
MKTLHIIEPTLNNTAGHCFTVVHALAMAAREGLSDHHVHVWTGHHFDAHTMHESGANIHRYFYRRIRRLQLWWLLRDLLTKGDGVLLPTAGRSELAIYSFLSRKLRQKGDAWFYFHQLRMDGAREARLRLLTQRIPEANILCTHPALQRIVRDSGFNHALLQPCPFAPPLHPFKIASFQHIIFPGEARLDKNFPFLLTLVRYMHEQQMTIPIMIQAGPNHHGHYSVAIAELIQSLRNIGYAYLNMPQQAFSSGDYLDQFTGGLCLQPYRSEDYAAKISGITLDALTRGCPCIAATNTWPADVLNEFGAGKVCEALDVQIWMQAIMQVIDDYPRYQQQCRQAMDVLSIRHHPMRTLETITGYGSRYT